MLAPAEINKIVNFYVEKNSNLTRNKINLLEEFRQTEIKLKDYVEALNELEKKQNKINLKEFGGLKNRTIQILTNFNPKDIDYNIHRVNETVIFFDQIEIDLIEVSEALVALKRIWSSFLKRNKEFAGTIFDEFVNQRFNHLERTIESVTPQEIGVLSSDIENEKQDIEKIIFLIEKIKDYLSYNIFIGKEAKEIESTLQNLLSTFNEISVPDFIEKAKKYLDLVDQEKRTSKLGQVRVPVIKVVNKTDRSIYKYTVLFDDHLVKYESFFNSDNIELIDTKQFIYLEDFPLKGIFAGRKIVENLMIDNDYLNAVESLNSTSQLYFSVLGIFIVFTTAITSFLNEYIIIFNLIMSLLILLSFNPLMKFLKKQAEFKFKLKKFFTFTKLNYFIVKEGDDLNIKEILAGIIRDFDNTVLNEKFHEGRLEK